MFLYAAQQNMKKGKQSQHSVTCISVETNLKKRTRLILLKKL